MTDLYLETSAVLRWLLQEPPAKEIIRVVNQAEKIITSVLTLVESRRAMMRLLNSGEILDGEMKKNLGTLQQAASGWEWVEMEEEIRERAGKAFPVEPVRTLDALHLATMLELMKIYPDLKILSFDKRILDNLEPLGLSSVTLEG